MKKILLWILLAIMSSLPVGAQTYKDAFSSTQNNKDTKPETENFHSIIRFKPAAVILSYILYRTVDVGVTYVRYVHPRVGIPVDLEFAYNGLVGFSVMTGIEAVPAIYREKSGLYLNFEAGLVYLDGDAGFAFMTNAGYQLVTKKRFVFTPAVGLRYEGVNKILGFNIMLDIGFAF
jgi:hypothetical protein